MVAKLVMKVANWPSLVLITLCVGAVLGLVAFSVGSKTGKQKKEVPDRNRIRWHVTEAKKEGRQTVEIPAPMIDYMGSKNRGLEDILNEYTIVVARPVAKQTLQCDDNNLITWYKFV